MKKRKRANIKYSKQEAQKIINELFKHYHNQPTLDEDEIKKYLIDIKGWTEEEVIKLIYDAWRHDIIYIGAKTVKGKTKKVIWRPEDFEAPPPSTLANMLKELKT